MVFEMGSILSLGAVVIALLSLLDRFYGRTAKLVERVVALEGRTTDPQVLQRIATLETKTGPFWRVLEEHMVDLLKQPTHLKMDALLDEYKKDKEGMSLEKLRELKREMLAALEEAKSLTDRKSEGRTFGYIVLLGILESRISEREIKEGHKKPDCAERGVSKQ